MDVGLFIVNGCIQPKIEDGDLAADDGLETAMLISLFSDQRVTDEELPPGIEFKRGWWGDGVPAIVGDQIGSKIWTLDRAKTTDATLVAIETFAREALAWMLEDGAASSIEATAEYDTIGRINLALTISRPTGDQSRFDVLWDNQELLRA